MNMHDKKSTGWVCKLMNRQKRQHKKQDQKQADPSFKLFPMYYKEEKVHK